MREDARVGMREKGISRRKVMVSAMSYVYHLRTKGYYNKGYGYEVKDSPGICNEARVNCQRSLEDTVGCPTGK